MINFSKDSKPFYELFQFAFFPDYENSIEFLANNLASKEIWDFSDSLKKNNSILKNYLEYTFRKLKQENKIAFKPDNKFACFNTGLVTENLEDIFAFFEEYKFSRPDSLCKFYFKGFFKKSDNKILLNFSGNIPDVANFFDKPELLIYNPKYELVPDLDHILKDNHSRFPLKLQNSDESEIRRLFNGAIEDIKKRVRANYKIAIPQYFDKKIQLLLPLYLTSGSSNPDLALVIHLEEKNTYSARTILTLKMAYTNARLIVKPESNWLKP